MATTSWVRIRVQVWCGILEHRFCVMLFRGLLLSFVIVPLTSCGQTELSDLPTEYVKTIRGLGFQAVYPPRQGFQVGDIYLRAVYQPNPDDPHKNFRTLVGSLPVGISIANKFADSRLLFEETSGNGSWQQFDYASDRAPTRRRMLQVAFPNVTARVVAGVNIGFFDAIRSLVGSASQATHVTVSFPDVRFMQLPLAVGDNLLDIVRPFVVDLEPLSNRHRIVLQNDTAFPGCGDAAYHCYYTIVTTVYYVRQLTYTFGDASSLAVSAGIVNDPITDANGNRISIPLSPLTVVVDTKLSDDATSKEISTKVTEAIQKEFAKGADKSVGLGVLRDTQRSFRFQQTFANPVAIAWDGFHITSEMTSKPKGLTRSSGGAR